jgi:FdhD protein
MPLTHRPINYRQFKASRWETAAADVVVEAPVTLTVNGRAWLAFMCTPADLEALAVGFLYNEGLVDSPVEVASVRACASGENVDVWLRRDVTPPAAWRRTAGCTGGATATRLDPGRLTAGRGLIAGPDLCLAPEQVGALMHQLLSGQALYREAGGVHSSALSDGRRLLRLAEDIGRHNTLDKLAGLALLDGVAPAAPIVLTTGRVSSEMAQKAVRLGASVAISRTAASSLAIRLAEQAGLTLIGYARRDRFTVYTHPARVAGALDWDERESAYDRCAVAC